MSHDANPMDQVWSASPILAQLRAYALSKGAVPSAVLGWTLARVALEVRPWVKLPGYVGTPAALNIGVCLVATSGGGKSMAEGVSAEALDIRQGMNRQWQDALILPGGTGEGIAASYLEQATDEDGDPVKGAKQLIGDPRRCFSFDEAETFSALMARTGSTLRATMKAALTGGTIGNTNGSTETTRRVQKGSYRFVATVCVQPSHSGGFFQDELGGMPQRFLWVRAEDRNMPAYEDVFDPATGLPRSPVEPIVWHPPTDFPGGVIDYPPAIRTEVQRAIFEKARGHGDPLKGHENLTRLKVAALLAVLHGQVAIDQKWWGVAAVIVDESMAVQRECKRALLAEQVREARVKATVADAAEAARIETKQARALRLTLDYLAANGPTARESVIAMAEGHGIGVRTWEQAIRGAAEITRERDGFQGQTIYALAVPQ